jgi:hypothetical protein
MFALALLAGMLSACTIYVRPGDFSVSYKGRYGVELNTVITRFEPDRGRASTYRLGEFVRFTIGLSQPGYITLVGIDSDGVSYEFSRYSLGAGTHVLAGPQGQPGLGFQLAPPAGIQRVRAIYTNLTGSASVRFTGTYRDDAWDSHTALYFERTGAQARDVEETYFYIVR